MENKRKQQFQISVFVILFIAAFIVVTTAVIAYRSISSVVVEVEKEAKPDYKLVVLKSIISDLSDAESSAKSFSILKDESYLDPYYANIYKIDLKLERLYSISKDNQDQIILIDSIANLIQQKYTVLNQLIELNKTDRVDEALQKASNKVDIVSLQSDTTRAQSIAKNDKKKSNFLKSIFSKSKKQEEPLPIAVPIKRTDPTAQIKKEIVKIKTEEAEKTIQIKEQEFRFNQQDKIIMDNIRAVIKNLEKQEYIAIYKKTKEAEINIAGIKKAIAVFCILVCVMLLIAAILIVINSKKNYEYRIALNRAKTEAENLAKARENFLSNMSHEIRTPINAILGFSEQLSNNNDLSNDTKQKTNIISKSAKHLLSLVNDILDISKLNANKIGIENVSFNLKEQIDDIFNLMESQRKNPSIQLNYNIEKVTTKNFIGDPVRLKQILINLIGNALKFTHQGKVQLTIIEQKTDEQNSTLYFSVMDTGIGIAKDKLSVIFNEFEQADAGTTKKYGGTGLGLTITKKIIELLHGTISVESEQEVGTTVHFSIPYQSTSDIILQTIPKETTAINTQLIAGKTLLIADDEQYNRMLLSTIFSKWKVNYFEVENGKEVIQELNKRKYDLILMDLFMPVMNGFESASSIRKIDSKQKNIPIIAITAATSPSIVEQCKAAGINTYLSKPFSELSLFLKICDTLHIDLNGKTIPPEEIKSLEKSYNLDSLRQLANGDPNFINEMIELFIKTTAEGILNIQDGLKNNNYAKIADMAHKISSPCRHIEANDCLLITKEIELKAKQNSKAEIEQLLDRLIPLFEKLQHQLKMELK